MAAPAQNQPSAPPSPTPAGQAPVAVLPTETVSVTQPSPSVATASPASTPAPTAAPTPTSDPTPAAPQTPAPTPTPTQTPAATTPPKSVTDLLLSQGSLTQEQLQQVQVEATGNGESALELAERKGFITPQQHTLAKAQFYGIPFVDVADLGVSPEALTHLPEGVARRYGMLPFAIDKSKNSLSVAMRDPLDLTAIDFASQKTGMTVIPHYAVPQELERTLQERYAQNLGTEVSAALEDTQKYQQRKQQVTAAALSGEVVRQAPIAKIVETVLTFAMKSRASDVHIEPQEQKTRVRYRIDGVLQEKLILPQSVHEAVVSRIKILSDLKIDEKRVPQDGRFNFSTDEQSVDLRVSTLPTVHGEKVVMRLLKKDNEVPDLPDLGLRGLALQHLQQAIKIPHGIILVTGPTGSGKTTTLYSLLHKLNTPKVNIMTLEDPVEYQMPGVNQVQVNPQAGLDFASGLRSFLRQDPNIIMVGEIRDTETVELAIQASLTGHLVFSTLHTSSAAGAIPRLLDMGAETFLLASSLTAIVAQRIVRTINSEFKEEYKPEPAVIEDMKQVLGPMFDTWCKQQSKTPEQIMLSRPSQNRPANEPEYKGRIGIYEVMPITEDISKLILERKPASDIEKLARQQGMLLMKQDGYLKALEGVTTLEEVLRVAEV